MPTRRSWPWILQAAGRPHSGLNAGTPGSPLPSALSALTPQPAARAKQEELQGQGKTAPGFPSHAGAGLARARDKIIPFFLKKFDQCAVEIVFMGKINKLLDFLPFILWLRNVFIFNGGKEGGEWKHHDLFSAWSL